MTTLNIPLMTYSEGSKLNIIYNKKKIIQDLPYKHKLYIKTPKGVNKTIDLFTKDVVNVELKEFTNTADTYKEAKYTSEPHFILPYVEQMFVQNVDYFKQYPQTDDLTILTFDIETYNRGNGRFPKAETEPITIISYKINDNETEVINLYNDKDTDKLILEEFLKVFEKYDPDVVVGYNMLLDKTNGFDLPYIIQRCLIHKLNTNPFSRFNQSCWRKNQEGNFEYFLKDRCVFDVYNMTQADQSLSGITNLKLETVADWYKIETFKWEDIYKKESSQVLKDPRLIQHVKSDVDATYKLFKIYFRIKTALSELMSIPFDNIVNCYSSFVPKIFLGREMFKRHLTPFENNEARYQSTNIQAALIDVWKAGYKKYIYAIDAASFYPSVMRTFNLGPDTVKFLGFKDKTDLPVFNNQPDYLELEMPDNNFNKNFHMIINKKKVSSLKSNMDGMFSLRGEFKYKAQQTENEEEKSKLESQSSSIKVIMNTIYGALTNKYSLYGDLASAVCIVGFARWILSSVINRYKENVIYFHTDSMFADCKIDLEECNKFVKELVETKTGMENKIVFEEKGEFSGYFYKKGNYILKKSNGKIEYHGVSMKSSRTSKYVKDIINEIGRQILNDIPKEQIIEYVKESYTLNSLKLEDFLQTSKITKYNNELLDEKKEEDSELIYKNPNALNPALMSRMKELYNTEIIPGDSIDYYKIKTQYKLTKKDLNFDLFRKNIYNNKNKILYSIYLNSYLNLDNSELINRINLLLSDKTLPLCVNIDPQLITNETYREIFIKKTIKRHSLETICVLNRMLFDIIFEEEILNKYKIGGYVLANEVSSKEELDMEYYRDNLRKSLEMFDLDPYSLLAEGISLESWSVFIKPKKAKDKIESDNTLKNFIWNIGKQI